MSFHQRYAITEVITVITRVIDESFVDIQMIMLSIISPAEMEAKIGQGLISTMW